MGKNITLKSDTTMNFPKGFSASLILVFLIITVTGCSRTPKVQPVLDLEEEIRLSGTDLVVARKTGPDGNYLKGPEGFCNIKDASLLISVKNLGRIVSPASTTSVVFFSRGSGAYQRFDLETPPVGGTPAELILPLPDNACALEECIFSITVDSKNEIDEGIGEQNNTVDALCVI